MSQAVASRFLLLLFLIDLSSGYQVNQMPNDAASRSKDHADDIIEGVAMFAAVEVSEEPIIAGQGWRNHHAPESRQELQAKFQNFLSPVSQPSADIVTQRWALRDKKVMNPEKARELAQAQALANMERHFVRKLEGQAGLSPVGLKKAEKLMEDTFLLAFMFAAAAFIVVFIKNISAVDPFEEELTSGMEQKSFPKSSQGFDLSNVELVQQALIVMRHTSTCAMHRVLDFAEMGTDCLGLTPDVRQTSRQLKKNDPDVEVTSHNIVELNDRCKSTDDDFFAHSLADLETLSLKIQCPSMATDAFTPSLDTKDTPDDDSVSKKEVREARPSDLEPIDELVNKIQAAL